VPATASPAPDPLLCQVAQRSTPPDLVVDVEGVSVPLVSATAAELDVQVPSQILPSPHSFRAFPITLHSSSSPFASVLHLDLHKRPRRHSSEPARPRTGSGTLLWHTRIFTGW